MDTKVVLPNSKPLSHDELADLAFRQIEGGQAEAALEVLSRLVHDEPDIDRYQFRLGLALERLGQTDEALERFRLAVQLNPTFGVFHHKYMNSLAARRDFHAAFSAYEALAILGDLGADLRVYFVQALLEAGCDPALLLSRLPGAFGVACNQVELCAEGELPRGAFRVTKASLAYNLVVHPSVLEIRVLSERLQAMTIYLDWLAQSSAPDGTALLSVDDLPPQMDGPVLCFSGARENELLVPDALFLASDGYRHLKTMAAQHQRPWVEKLDRAYWRGALTGLAGDVPRVMGLPRVTLCRIATGHDDIDAKLTDISQFNHWRDALEGEFDRLGLMGPRESEAENFKYRWMIDIDGNSNAWAGFYLKLLTKSPVIKLISPMRQWYYDRISAARDYIAIDDLEVGLPAALAWCRAHEAEAKDIGMRGEIFANTLTVPGEFHVFQSAFENAVSIGGDF